MWRQAGITANIKQFDQSQYILTAVNGSFQVNAWRQFAEPDPDGDYVWWHCSSVEPLGQLGLNFPRNCDQQISQALDTGRTNPDPAARVKAYQTIGKRFAQDLPYLWISHSLWVLAFKPDVKDVVAPTLPDGSLALSPVAGFTPVSQIWLDR